MKRDTCHLLKSVSHQRIELESANFNNCLRRIFFFFGLFVVRTEVIVTGEPGTRGKINCSETRLEQG